MSYNF